MLCPITRLGSTSGFSSQHLRLCKESHKTWRGHTWCVRMAKADLIGGIGITTYRLSDQELLSLQRQYYQQTTYFFRSDQALLITMKI